MGFFLGLLVAWGIWRLVEHDLTERRSHRAGGVSHRDG
jgi:hypothetical protein